MAKRIATPALICTMGLPATAAAEATWADLFPLMGKVILLGLPLEIAQFSYHLWPLMVALAVLAWIIRGVIVSRGWDARIDDGLSWGSAGLLGILLRPWLITGLAIFTLVVAIVASLAVKPELLQNKRFSLVRLGQAFLPMAKPEPSRPVIPFTLPDGRPWPKVATEFHEQGSPSAEHAGPYAFEIENNVYQGGVYAKLCDSERLDCPPIRAAFIPKGGSITLKALAGSSYRLHYRLVDDVSKVGRSRGFTLPGKESYYSAPSGAGVVQKEPTVGNGTFLHGDANLAAQIKLPLSMVSMEYNPKHALFKLIQPKEF